LQCRKNLQTTNQGSSGRIFFFKHRTPKRSFASALCSSVQAKQPSGYQKEPAGTQKQQVASQAWCQSVEANIVNSNAMEDMFVAFTVVQQIMIGLSATMSEDQVSFIT
jgi:hypothetical protein